RHTRSYGDWSSDVCSSDLQRLNPDNVQEFRTITLGATAENGRNSGANVMVATKSGTNAIHGDVFEFLRNNALNSNEWYNSANHRSEERRVGKECRSRWDGS